MYIYIYIYLSPSVYKNIYLCICRYECVYVNMIYIYPPLPNHSASGPYTHTKPLVLTFDASSEMSTKLWNR